MTFQLPVEKTEEEKAQLSWYRKVYEDRLGKHLPSKRLGDSIEARREAYAYSRHFTAELNAREDDLNKSLSTALKVLLSTTYSARTMNATEWLIQVVHQKSYSRTFSYLS